MVTREKCKLKSNMISPKGGSFSRNSEKESEIRTVLWVEAVLHACSKKQ